MKTHQVLSGLWRRIRLSALWMLLLALTALPALQGAGRGKITGRVTDRATGEPLPGVNVLVVGTTMGGSADMNGYYFVANVPPGAYSLRATMVGYRPMTVTDVRIHPDQTTEVSLAMEEETIQLGEEIVVTATRPLVERDVTASRRVVESQEIKVLPTSQLDRVLTTLPGVDVTGGVMTVRGGSMDQVALMYDGTRVRNPIDQSPYVNFNLSAVQELEVITGSYNAEYGEAQSGVINIITKDGGQRYTASLEGRLIAPGKRHWGDALYDYSSPLYWENSHARHLQWWIDNPDQWVDNNGRYGNDPNCSQTPEQAYDQYIQTHQPITDYTKTPTYQLEGSLGGPVPFLGDLRFFLTARYRSQAPLFGNSYRDRGQFYDGTLKLSYDITPSMKLLFSGFYALQKTSWGIFEVPDNYYATNFGYQARYAYYDYAGLPQSSTDGQTLRLTHVVNPQSMYEVKLSRISAYREMGPFPDDPNGWAASGITTTDNLRALDENGQPLMGAYSNPIGYNTLGYYNRNNDRNDEWTFAGFYSNQFNREVSLKVGGEFTYYHLDHFNESKQPAIDRRVYEPYQGAAWAQSKLELGGFIMNIGLRYDFYNPNDTVYTNIFAPFTSGKELTKTFTQLSPRLGIAHPIDDRTVLHFFYGHFFQRGSFADYGEGYLDEDAQGSLTTFVNPSTGGAVILGNRQVKPSKNVQFEVGIERNFADIFILDVTGYYKDITNTIRVAQIADPAGGISYRTNANGDYADIRGLEISLRKLPSYYTSGYVNFSTQLGVDGRSGDPVIVYPDRNVYGPSGDFIAHYNPRLKAALFFQTPREAGLLGGVLDDVLVSLEYVAIFANDKLLQDVFTYSATKARPADQNMNVRLSKGFSLGKAAHITAYFEVFNALNSKWINFAAVEKATQEDQKAFVHSDFKQIPNTDVNGMPILDTAMYRNLPRYFLFGLMIEL